jgi:hypothetical protein
MVGECNARKYADHDITCGWTKWPVAEALADWLRTGHLLGIVHKLVNA